jgi:predicted transcriptional regulator of viral defense system
MDMKNTARTVRQVFASSGGMMRTSDAIRAGIHPEELYRACDRGELVQVSRGVYRLTDLPPISNPDLVTVALRAPNAVICLVSALSFHEMTTQVPHEVSIALKKGDETPRIAHPPIVAHRFSGRSFAAGVEEHTIDEVKVRIYSPEKTLADCFKFRNKIVEDIVIEALKLYRTRRPFKGDELLRFARVCRVEKVMRPYLEAII